MSRADIPQELKDRKQWITWEAVPDGKGGIKKIPNGRTNAPDEWHTFEEIKDAENIAYVFHEDDPYVGIDLDDCYDGKFADWAGEIVERFRGKAYGELSPSGTGVKLIVRAKKPAGSRCQFISGNVKVECYEDRRFWAMTGLVGERMREITECQDDLDWLIEKYLKVEQPKLSNTRTIPMPVAASDLLKRAGDYVDRAELAGEGGRNNAAFRLAGHLFAMEDNYGAHLTQEQVEQFVSVWNGRLPVPLPDSEVLQVVSSALKNGSARATKQAELEISSEPHLDIDWDALGRLASSPREDDEDPIEDEEFYAAMVPATGTLRKIYDYYLQSAYRPSHTMGLCAAVGLMGTLLGRRVRSHTDLRTNDYHLIAATTGSGKEAVETTISRILLESDPTGMMLIPADIQSGNGLMKAVANCQCGIWVCDEFGKILQAVLDKKGSQHLKNIGTHLLKLYGKSAGLYGGAAHADGVRNRVVQPHLTVVGMGTPGSVFSALDSEQVSDGLVSRIAFWLVPERPVPRRGGCIGEVPEDLRHDVAGWIGFQPTDEEAGNLAELAPQPVTLPMSQDALRRWEDHAEAINARMDSESELRAAIWSRVAARTMKLAMIHRCSRLGTNPSITNWDFVAVELDDVNWGIRLSNWLAGVACALVRENIPDRTKEKAKALLVAYMQASPEGFKLRELTQRHRTLTKGDLHAAMDELGFWVEEIKPPKGGRPARWIRPAQYGGHDE